MVLSKLSYFTTQSYVCNEACHCCLNRSLELSGKGRTDEHVHLDKIVLCITVKVCHKLLRCTVQYLLPIFLLVHITEGLYNVLSWSLQVEVISINEADVQVQTDTNNAIIAKFIFEDIIAFSKGFTFETFLWLSPWTLSFWLFDILLYIWSPKYSKDHWKVKSSHVLYLRIYHLTHWTFCISQRTSWQAGRPPCCTGRSPGPGRQSWSSSSCTWCRCTAGGRSSSPQRRRQWSPCSHSWTSPEQ